MHLAVAQQVSSEIAQYLRPRFRRYVLVSIFCLMFLLGVTDAATARKHFRVTQTGQQPADVRSLEVGQLITRELSPGQSHSYQVSLAAGQYAHVLVEQKGIDVVVKLFAPDGKLITQFDSPNGSLG